MIAFGCSITVPDIYERCAKPGIRMAAEPDSEVFALASAGSIFRSHNLILERAATREDLEALVLVHQDAEIVDPDFCSKLRRAVRDPDVGVVGCLGAVGVRSIAWWEGSVTWASSVYRYGELGGGELPAVAWNGDEPSPELRTGEVDTVDGFLMVLSPWVVRNLRFDESLALPHGYDFDFCLQVRAAGRKVVTEDFKVAHHHALKLISNPEPWIEAHIRVAEKWEGRMPNAGAGADDWKQRARRAEAAAAAAWLLAASRTLQADARARQHESRLREMTDSLSWRITAPLRRLNAMRRAARRRSRPAGVRTLPSRSPAVHEARGAGRGTARSS
jgi:GT2 family glycosyltransferase